MSEQHLGGFTFALVKQGWQWYQLFKLANARKRDVSARLSSLTSHLKSLENKLSSTMDEAADAMVELNSANDAIDISIMAMTCKGDQACKNLCAGTNICPAPEKACKDHRSKFPKQGKQMTRVTCSQCGWKGNVDELAKGIDPFDNTMEILACPKCNQLENTIRQSCDEPGCWQPATCGYPMPTGYRTTCNDHYKPQ